MARKKYSSRKKSKKGKKNTLETIRKVCGPLNDDRLGFILWGAHFKTSIKPDIVPAFRPHQSVPGRSMSSETRQFSDILRSRINAPLPPPTRERTTSCMSDASRISDKDRDIAPPPSSYSPALERARIALLGRIKKKLDSTEIVMDLLALSAEMYLLRNMLVDRDHSLLHMSEDDLQKVKHDASIIAQNAHQTQLLQAAGDGVGFAEHLRNVWEILYFRGSGGIALPDVGFRTIDRQGEEGPGEVVLKDTVAGFGRAVPHIDGCCVDNGNSDDDDDGEDDLLRSLDSGSAFVGGEGDMDEEEDEMERRWAFTSESVEDYLRRRKAEDEEHARLLESSGGVGLDKVIARTEVLTDGSSTTDGALSGELNPLVAVASTGSDGAAAGAADNGISCAEDGTNNLTKAKKKNLRVGFVNTDVNSSYHCGIEEGNSESVTCAQGDHEGGEGDAESGEDSMTLPMRVEIGNTQARLSLKAVTGVVKYLSGSFGSFSRTPHTPALAHEQPGNDVAVIVPPTLHKKELMLIEGGSPRVVPHPRMSQHMIDLIALQQKQKNNPMASPHDSGDDKCGGDGTWGRPSSSREMPSGDDTSGDDLRFILTPTTPSRPNSKGGARGILRRGIVVPELPDLPLGEYANSVDSSMVVSATASTVDSSHISNPPLVLVADAIPASPICTHHNSIVKSSSTIDPPDRPEEYDVKEEMFDSLESSITESSAVASQGHGSLSILARGNSRSMEDMSGDDSSLKPELEPSIVSTTNPAATQSTIAHPTASPAASSKMRIDIRLVDKLATMSLPTVSRSLQSHHVVTPAGGPSKNTAASSPTDMTLQPCSESADGLLVEDSDRATEHERSMSSIPGSSEPFQRQHSVMSTQSYATATTVYRPDNISPAPVPPKGALLMVDDDQSHYITESAQGLLSHSFVWQKCNSSSFHVDSAVLPFDCGHKNDPKLPLKRSYVPPLMKKRASNPSIFRVEGEKNITKASAAPENGLGRNLSTISDIEDESAGEKEGGEGILADEEEEYQQLFIENCRKMSTAPQVPAPPEPEWHNIEEGSTYSADDICRIKFVGSSPGYSRLLHSEEITVSERLRRLSALSNTTGDSSGGNKCMSFRRKGYGVGDEFIGQDEEEVEGENSLVHGSSSLSLGTRPHATAVVDLSRRIDPKTFQEKMHAIASPAQAAHAGTALKAVTMSLDVATDKESSGMSGNGRHGARTGSTTDDGRGGGLSTITSRDEVDEAIRYRLKPYERQLKSGERVTNFKKVFISYPIHMSGGTFAEMFYDEVNDHFNLTRVHNGEVVLDISIPFAEVSSTECLFDNMVTLRATSDQLSDDYIASIPMEDWRTIINHERKAFYRQHTALSAQTGRPPLPSTERPRDGNHATNQTSTVNARPTGFYSSAMNTPRAGAEDSQGAMESVLHLFTATTTTMKAHMQKPPDVNGSDMGNQFGFLPVESQEQDDTTFLTGYDGVGTRDSTPPMKSIHREELPEVEEADDTKPLSVPLPPMDGNDDDAHRREVRAMRKLYRKYRPIKSYEGVSVDCLHKDLPRSRPVTTIYDAHRTRSLSPTERGRKPAVMSIVDGEDDCIGTVTPGGCIDDMSASFQDRTIVLHHRARSPTAVATDASTVINLHSQSQVEQSSNQDSDTRPKSHTSAIPTKDIPSNIRTRPLTSQFNQSKQSLQAKLLDTDITQPLKAGYSLTTTVSPRGTSSCYHSRATTAHGSSSVVTAMSDSQVRRPKSMQRSDRGPRAATGKHSKCLRGIVRTPGLPANSTSMLCDFIAVPDVVAPPYPHDSDPSPSKQISTSVKVITLQTALDSKDKSILSLHSVA